MGLSLNDFTFDGVNDAFDLNFALGYTARADVTCYRAGDMPMDIAFDWLTDSRVRIDMTDLTTGDSLVFARTVSKTTLPVDLTSGGSLTRENMTVAVTHSLHAMHELLDGRFGDVVEVGDAVYALVEVAVQAALTNFLFSAQFKQDMVLRPEFTAAETVTFTSGGLVATAASAAVYVETNPSVPVEVLVYNGGSVKFSFTVGTDGTVSGRSTADVALTAGAVSVEVTGGAYSSGLKAGIVFPFFYEAVLDFEAEVSDYIAIFEEARTT
jgi:hypothetical protein